MNETKINFSKPLPKLIGFSGRQFSGKTALGKYLTENYGYKRLFVAEALKTLCSLLYNLSIEEMDKLKKSEAPLHLGEREFKIIADETGIAYDDIVKEFATIDNAITSTRHAYHFVGTELIRKYKPDWHIDSTMGKIKPDEKYIIDDVRFPNEIDAIVKEGGIMIYVVRPDLSWVSHHASEESVNWKDFKNFIINHREFSHATEQLMTLLKTEKNAYADDFLKKYNFPTNIKSYNKEIAVEKYECPAHVIITNRTIGWVEDEWDGMTHPFEIEEYKKYI